MVPMSAVIAMPAVIAMVPVVSMSSMSAMVIMTFMVLLVTVPGVLFRSMTRSMARFVARTVFFGGSVLFVRVFGRCFLFGCILGVHVSSIGFPETIPHSAPYGQRGENGEVSVCLAPCCLVSRVVS